MRLMHERVGQAISYIPDAEGNFPSPFHLGNPLSRLLPPAVTEIWTRWQTAVTEGDSSWFQQAYAANIRMRWNWHSNAIEGNRLGYDEACIVLQFNETVSGHRPRDLEELRGHDAAIRKVRDLARQKLPVTEDVLCEWHHLSMVRDQATKIPLKDGREVDYPIRAGEYKELPNGVRLPDGSMHRFAPPDEVPDLMRNFIKDLESTPWPEPGGFPEYLAKFHSRFLAIHPFADGNGRMGRLLNGYLCLRVGFPVSIVSLSHRSPYMRAMRYSNQHNLEPLHRLLAATLVHEMEFGLAALKGECDPTPDNKEADTKRPCSRADVDEIVYPAGWWD